MSTSGLRSVSEQVLMTASAVLVSASAMLRTVGTGAQVAGIPGSRRHRTRCASNGGCGDQDLPEWVIMKRWNMQC